MSATRILLVDANPIRRAVWRSTLVSLPACLLVGESGDMVRGGQMAQDLRPDLLLIGHELPECGGLHLARKVADTVPETKVMMVGNAARSADLLQALRAGVREYLVNPSPHELRAAITRLTGAGAPPDPAPAGQGRIISCFATKGGTGQSSLALNLAVALRQASGQPVALVDLNGRHGQLDLMLDLYPEASWLDVLSGGVPLERALHEHRSGVTFLQGSRRHEPLGPDQVHGLLHALQRRFAYVLVDCDKRPSPGTLAALRRSEPVLVPVRLDLGGLRGGQLALQVLDEAGIAPGQVQLVLIGPGSDSALTPTGAAGLLKHSLCWRLPEDTHTATQAVDRGVPYVVGAPRTGLSRQVQGLARHLLGSGHHAEAPSRGLGLTGLWLKWRGRHQPERRTYWRAAQ